MNYVIIKENISIIVWFGYLLEIRFIKCELIRGGYYVKQKKNKLIMCGCVIFLSFLLNFQVKSLDQINQRLENVYQKRYPSYLLVNELRQSTFVLMLHTRHYIEKNDPRYEQYYHDIIAIRAGEKPRPKEYEGVYWQYGIVEQASLHSAGQQVSLHALIEANHFSLEELRLLQKAEKLADELTITEQIAIDASNGVISVDNQKKLLIGETSKDFSARIINDDSYEQLKQTFVTMLNQIITLLDEQTDARVEQVRYQRELIVMTIMLTMVLIGVNIFVIIASFFKRWRRVGKHARREIKS